MQGGVPEVSRHSGTRQDCLVLPNCLLAECLLVCVCVCNRWYSSSKDLGCCSHSLTALCCWSGCPQRKPPHGEWPGAGDAAGEAPFAFSLVATKKAVGLWLWPSTELFWKEPNSLPNPELLPGFLSWKLFLMGTPLCCGKSNISESQGSMLSPSQLDQLCCLPLLHSRYFSFNSPSRVFCGLLSLSPSGQAVIWGSLGVEPCTAVPL